MGFFPSDKKTAPREPTTAARQDLSVSFDAEGACYRFPEQGSEWQDLHGLSSIDRDTAALLSQIVEEGFATSCDTSVMLPWSKLYQLLASDSYEGCGPLLRLPPILATRPVLKSQHSLTDRSFSINLAGWIDAAGNPLPDNFRLNGAVISFGLGSHLLPQAAWELTIALRDFFQRSEELRDFAGNTQGWSRIRECAVRARAGMSDFLQKTIVVTPQMLDLQLRSIDFGDSRTVEVIPSFQGAPERWLETFDKLPIADHYRVSDGELLTHVIVSDEVKSVLSEIKRMPGRRVSCERAEAFIRNPFSVLGPEAARVIDPEKFDQAREDAGLHFSRFTVRVQTDTKGFPSEVALFIEEMAHEEIRSEEYRFQDDTDLERFICKLEGRIERGAQCCLWKGFELELLGDAGDQLDILKSALCARRGGNKFSSAELFDLSRYSDRIEAIGVEKPYYSPFIARKSVGDPWVPENTDFGICFTPEGETEPVALSLDKERMKQFRDAINRAKAVGAATVKFPGLPKELTIGQAEDLIGTIEAAQGDVAKGEFKEDRVNDKAPVHRKGLIVKPNIEKLSYLQERGSLEMSPEARPVLPSGLKPATSLKEHQEYGVAWLQNLWQLAPQHCRGALLADDMGLGKTLQLLTFIASCFEADPNLAPVLVVAPLTLLENWQDETDKFFQPGTFPLLTLYGPALAAKRTSRADIGADLLADGVTRLLRRDWLGEAKLVLTTYETMRDFELSLSAQKWSIMVMDEAQKAKNPNAMMTRAAKKQNVKFKIACTGTPVENTLTDLWCLFDFIQPGLLGALNEFGGNYRKPIEAETDEEKQKVEELRGIIAPQILRREKKDVAKDLPRKHFVQECKTLPLSSLQRQLYGHAVANYKAGKNGDTGATKMNHLGLLQYIRQVCTDPRPLGQGTSEHESFEVAASRSPKLAWLDGVLKEIKGKGEKAIVFTELRGLQRILKIFIAERLGVVPEIINGDTSTASANAQSRQKKIKQYQERPGFGVIILSPLAVGFGVNIQAANHVIHYTRMWNPAKEDQATDRAYRIGQTRDVYVYTPVVVSPEFTTFDAKLDALLEWKRGISADMLNGAGDIGSAAFGDIQDVDGSHAFEHTLITMDEVQCMLPAAFESFCTLLWAKQGFSKTYRTCLSGDGGVDVVAISGKSGALLQCKTSATDGIRMGWDAVREVTAGTAAYTARHPQVEFRRIAVTNQYFNDAARYQARLNDVELVERDSLEALVSQYPVKQIELEQML
jgi:hypothetical protein